MSTAVGTPPTAPRRSWAWRYPPVITLIVGVILAGVLLPSALNLPQANTSYATGGPIASTYGPADDFSADRQNVQNALMARLNPQLQVQQQALLLPITKRPADLNECGRRIAPHRQRERRPLRQRGQRDRRLRLDIDALRVEHQDGLHSCERFCVPFFLSASFLSASCELLVSSLACRTIMPCATANCKKSVKKFSRRSAFVDAMRVESSPHRSEPSSGSAGA